MTNGNRGGTLAQEILLAVAHEYGWPAPGYQEVILAEVPREILEEIAGPYRLEEQGVEIRVMVEDDHLRMEIANPSGEGDPQVVLAHPTAENFFIDLADGTRFRVDRDDTGAVEAIQVLGGPRIIRGR
jgi:hypothetical protein